MRKEMLQIIHNSPLGIEKCKRRARDVLYWPGMSSEIEDFVSTCKICTKYQGNNRKEPLIPHTVPSRPWSKVGADLFEFQGKYFLILVDYYSKFIEVSQLKHTTSLEIINHCKSQFARHGIPDIFSAIMDLNSQAACLISFPLNMVFSIIPAAHTIRNQMEWSTKQFRL